MKLDKLIGERFKERPADCVVDSHAIMMRGGYIKNVGNGVYSSFAILKRMTQKFERIVREEMDRVDGQEVMFPVAVPASLWEESGRYESVGAELLRFKDRNDTPMVLGMTHEEPSVHLVREYGQSYTKYPFMIYQIQTKFRDEVRPRAGLIRTKEFTMKDAYSYHTSQEDLEAYYNRCHEAYERIFARAGVPEVISVKSDSGMMGGSVAHEFMLLVDAGEDTVVICDDCDYRSNMEAAERIGTAPTTTKAEIVKVATPNAKTIEDVCKFLKVPVETSCKAVVYQKADGAYVVVFIRGDLEINETKLNNFLGEEVYPANITADSGLVAGYTGPYDLAFSGKVQILYDNSLEGIQNLCCGANEEGHHYTGLCIERDCGNVDYHGFAKVVDGDICPACNKPSLRLVRGIELGNIFQLGTKYTKSMNMQYTDADGNLQHPVMGCYGVGIERTIAAICEARRDDYGPIWPLAIAPWHVHLCCVRADDPAVKEVADNFYNQLQDEGIEVIYDDRAVRPGVMFSDADLIGAPIRIICSPRNLEEGVCEIVTRDKSVQVKAALADVLATVKDIMSKL